MSTKQLEHAMMRAGLVSFDDMRLRFVESNMPESVDAAINFEHEGILELNEMSKEIKALPDADNHGAGHEGVYLRLPATPGDIGAAFGMLDQLGTGPVTIFDVECPVPNVRQYIINADVNDKETFDKLQKLAQKISTMDREDCSKYAGALDNESINSLDDMLSVAQNLQGYVMLTNVNTDADLGRFLVDSGFKDCPEDMQAYLNFEAIGRDYRSEYGGAFSSGGFVRRRSTYEPEETTNPIITLYMHTALSKSSGELPYPVKLPATEMQLDQIKERMGIDEFSEATITGIEFSPAYLSGNIPVECAAVGVANDLALEIEQMMLRDGELLKFFSVMEVEQVPFLRLNYGSSRS